MVGRADNVTVKRGLEILSRLKRPMPTECRLVITVVLFIICIVQFHDEIYIE